MAAGRAPESLSLKLMHSPGCRCRPCDGAPMPPVQSRCALALPRAAPAQDLRATRSIPSACAARSSSYPQSPPLRSEHRHPTTLIRHLAISTVGSVNLNDQKKSAHPGQQGRQSAGRGTTELQQLQGGKKRIARTLRMAELSSLSHRFAFAFGGVVHQGLHRNGYQALCELAEQGRLAVT